jgi:ABC-type dipeptide/oligopeptide/nickel transport system ATPase component
MVEYGSSEEAFSSTHYTYTRALLQGIPSLDERKPWTEIVKLKGEIPFADSIGI